MNHRNRIWYGNGKLCILPVYQVYRYDYYISYNSTLQFTSFSAVNTDEMSQTVPTKSSEK